MRIVFHIDMDAFYSAVETRENPSLKGKPVVVGADPKGGKGRGVVSTCNYEARKFGIHSGMPISHAYRLCPDAVYMPVNFELYWHASSEVMDVFRSYSEKFQQAGIDEAFLIPRDVSNYKDAENLARKIQAEISDREKLTCSIGIGPNKLIAKIASDFQKPNGLTIVEPHGVKTFLWPLPVRKLYGIGPKTEHVLKSMSINTIGELAKTDVKELVDVFGKWGKGMHDYANGIDDSELVENEEPKSIGREVTFEKDTNDTKMVHGLIADISEDIYTAAKQENFTFRTVVLKIRYENFETHTKQKSFKDEPSLENIISTGQHIFSSFKSKKKIRLIGFRLTRLSRLELKK